MRGLVLAVMLLALPAAAQMGAVYLPPPGSGVRVTLANQRQVTGVFLGEREGAVWVGVDGGEVGLEPADIVMVRQEDNEDAEYRRRAAGLGRDADGWWALARWAQAHALPGSAEDAARRVVELSPEHPGARALLRQEKVGDAWLSGDDIPRAKGLTLYGGEWLKREEAAALEGESRARRREERLDELLALQRAQAGSPSLLVLPLPGGGSGWWNYAPIDGNIESPEAIKRKGPYTVPWRPLEPFAPSFHEGYFRRPGF